MALLRARYTYHMASIQQVTKQGSLMHVRYDDGSTDILAPTNGAWWLKSSAADTPPPDPSPTDPGAGEGPEPAFERLTGQSSPNSSPRSAYGYPERPTGITIHHWGDPGQQFENVVNHLCNPASQVSAHCVVEAGRVAFLVPYTRAAWHAGSTEGNGRTVGLELRPEATDGDYETAAQLIKEIRGEFGNLPLYPHNRWFNTACPGIWDLGRLDALARSIPNPDPEQPPVTPTGQWVHPLPGGTVTSGYGASRGQYMHVGIDISDVGGTGMGGIVRAITDIRITVARENGTGGLPDAGTYYKAHTLTGEQYSFAGFHGHPGTLRVTAGQTLQAGAPIMNVGNSGNSFGSHLHQEIWPGHKPGDFFYWGDGTPPNPIPIMRAKGINI